MELKLKICLGLMIYSLLAPPLLCTNGVDVACCENETDPGSSHETTCYCAPCNQSVPADTRKVNVRIHFLNDVQLHLITLIWTSNTDQANGNADPQEISASGLGRPYYTSDLPLLI